jgi:major membrane immunogen (membrane-anchored lipoprotein)
LPVKDWLMKMILKKAVFAALSMMVVAVLVAGCGNSAESEKTKADAKVAAEKTADTAKDIAVQGKELAQTGAEKAAALATNVAADLKIGVEKADVVATNVVAKIKEGALKADDVVTNVVEQVAQKAQSLTK